MAYTGYRGYKNSGQNDQDPEQQLAALALIAQSQGVNAEASSPKEGFLQKITRILNVPRAAIAGITEYGDPIRGVQEDLDSTKIMRSKLGRELTAGEKALAFGQDVAFDPLTYLTFGTGTAAKIGGKVLTKAGTQIIKKAGNEAARSVVEKSAKETARKLAIDEATTKFAQGIKAADPEYLRYVDKGGIKFAGKTIVSGEKTGAAWKAANDKLEKAAPGVFKGITTVKDEAGKALVPSYGVKQSIKKLREAGDIELADKLDNYLKNKKTLSVKNQQAIDDAIKNLEPESKVLDNTKRAAVTNVIERAPTAAGVQTPTREIDRIYTEGRASTDAALTEAEKARKAADEVGKIEKIPSITPRRVDQLKAIGVKTIDDLIAVNPDELGKKFKTTFGREVGDLPQRLKAAAITQADDFVENTYKAQQKAQEAARVAETTKSQVEAARGSLQNVTDPIVRDAAIKIKDIYSKQYQELHRRGLLDAGIDDYAARNLTKEAREKILDDEGLGFAKGQLSTSIGSAGKHRTNQLTIAESEDLLKKKYGIKGDVYEKDALVNAANYQAKTQKAINNFDFHQEVMQKFGKQAPEVVTQVRDKTGKTKKVKDWADFTEPDGTKWVVPDVKWYKQTGTAVPEAVAKDLAATQKVLTNEESLGLLIREFDKIQNYWKTGVTGFFPSFHVRNIFGGAYNNWLAGLKDLTPYKQAGELLKLSGDLEKTLSPEKIGQIQKGLSNVKLANSFGETISGKELLESYDKFVGRGTGKVADMKTLTTAFANDTTSRALDWVQKQTRGRTEKIEEHLRLPLFIDTWKKTGNFEEAANKVFKFHFDYSQVGASAFENSTLKKLFPFYTWSRNNIPLQIEQILKQPGKQSATLKLFNSLVDPEVQAQLPSYLQQGLSVQTGPTKDGQTPVLTGLGLPIEDLNNVSTRGVLGMLSPIVKTPLEMSLDKSVFYDKPVSELGPQFAKYYQNYPKPVRDFLEIKEVTDKNGKKSYVGNPQKLYAFQSVAGRLTSSLYKSGDETIPGELRALNTLSGVNVRSVNLEDEKYYRSRALLDQYQKMLKEKGVLKSYTNYYQPKGTTVSEIK